jgi:2-methylcitrate dehydratase PrpD
MGVLDIVTKHLVETKYEALPLEIVEATKKQILDMLGVTVAGSTASISGEIKELVCLVKDWGGKEESSILAFGGRVPAPNAALVNGTLCARLDFDDTSVQYGGHPSRATVPTAFAIAEHQSGINGKELITATALGHDLGCRIAASALGAEESLYTITNFFSAAATAGRILGLNNEKMKYALSFAFHQICGARGGDGSAKSASVKGLTDGLICKAGIVSALLAERGFCLDWDILDPNNKNNFFKRYHNGAYSPSRLIADLGKIFAGAKTSQKEFPCCHGQQMALKATLDLIKENNIKADEVEKVIFHVTAPDYLWLAHPVEKKRNPENIIQTQFSLYWGIASAIVYGEVGIKNFSIEALKDVRIPKMVRKIYGKPDIELKEKKGLTPAIVEVINKDGKVYAKQVDCLFGSPEKPMSFADVAMKFRHCCEYSIKPVSEENQNKVIQMVEGLEQVTDVSQIVRLLA